MWVFVAVGLLIGIPASAAESAAVRSQRMTATLVSDADAVAPGQMVRLALRLRMAAGWHTYWSNPGDAGAPTELELELPPGASTGPIVWPAPQRMAEESITTYGYTGEVLLPVTVTAGARDGGAFHVAARANWLVCANICVPEEGAFSLDVPWGAPAPSAEAALIDAAVARAPLPSPFPARVTPSGELTLSGPELSPASVQSAEFFPAESGTIDQGLPQHARVEAGRVVVPLTPGSAFKPDGLAGVIVLRDPAGGERALTISAQAAPEPERTGLGEAALLALVGGLLLNLMPCVFPVLAMKAAGFARLSGAARGSVRAEALSYAAGVLVTFCALGGALMVARAAGAGVGWGVQFQSSAFVAAMAWLLFGVGLNLSGVFAAGNSLAATGGGLAMRRGHVGSFFTGTLAVLVAAPCTAPFMGAAIAAALALPAAAALVVFAVMGVGLASPYLALAAAPELARLLPRPGRWMEVLKGVLAFPMYGAAAWLVWVISVQSGPGGVLLAAAGLVLVGFAAWVLGLVQRGPGWRTGRAVALASLLAALALLPGLREAATPDLTAEAGTERFSAERLAQLRAEGRPVFVNMTAAWCVTCLVNERIALAPEAVRRAFADRNVAYLKGDWTRQDPAITAFLRREDRDGVPLYLFYPPGGEPTVLPQILTQAAILAQLDRLGGHS